MTTCIDNADDLIDSRDVIERIRELSDDEYRDAEDNKELSALTALAEEGADATEEWPHGAALIRDSYFRDYAQELAEDCCEMPNSSQWPLYCIDWDMAARDLRMDYSSVDFDGVTYWTR